MGVSVHNLVGLTEAYEIFFEETTYERLADVNQTTTGQYQADQEDRSFLRWNPFVPTSGGTLLATDTIVAVTVALPVSFVSTTPPSLSQWRVNSTDPNAQADDEAWLEAETGGNVLVADNCDVFAETGVRSFSFSAAAISAYQAAVSGSQTWFAITGRVLGFVTEQLQGTYARDPGATVTVHYSRVGEGPSSRRTLLGVGK